MPVRRHRRACPSRRARRAARSLLPEPDEHVREADEQFAGRPSARRIDFGSAWYARCASESPSTARSGFVTAWPRVARSPPSAGRSPRARPRADPARAGRRAGRARRRRRGAGRAASRLSVPLIAAGTSGTSAASAIRAAPRVRARLVLLPQSLLPARALGEHHDDVAVAAELDRRLDRLDVRLAAAHRERAAGGR